MDAIPARWFRNPATARLAAFLNDEPYVEDHWALTGDLKAPVACFGPNNSPNDDGFGIICDVVEPKSSRGRKMVVWFRGEEVEWIMKIAREVAIERRNRSLVDVKE